MNFTKKMTTPPIPFGKSPGARVGGVEPLTAL